MLARTLGRVTWRIDIDSPKAEAYRDTRGPGLDGWRGMLAAAGKRATTPKRKPDLALIRLMHDLGLRRGEVVTLDRADVDLEAGTVAIVGKGKSERVPVTLNKPAAAALADWIAARGDWAGALFVRLDRAAGGGQPGRLDAGNVARIAKDLGRRAGWRGAPTRTDCGTRGSREHSTWPTATCGRCAGSAGTRSCRRCCATTTTVGTRPGRSPSSWARTRPEPQAALKAHRERSGLG